MSGGRRAQETMNHNLRNSAEVLSRASSFATRRKVTYLNGHERGERKQDNPF